MPEQDFNYWKRAHQSRVEKVLVHFLPSQDTASVPLVKAMHYAVLEGGKRIRSLCVFAAGELTGAHIDNLEVIAAAVEMIHAYSLIHDDMPCMDDDDLRRGKPSCHIAFGEAIALLTGDALQTLAFEVLSKPLRSVPSKKQLLMVQILSQAIGCSGTVLGQAIDCLNVGRPLALADIERMHSLKTGALLGASIELGALCGNPLSQKEQAALQAVAQHIGLLFQIVDDILDCEATTPTLGKTAGKDTQQGKSTYVSVLGLAKAKQYAQKLSCDVQSELGTWGIRAAHLLALTHYMTHRSF